MSPERLQLARMALGPDASAEEQDALQEYITLGGNVAGL
jgi:hypothetical protein